MNEMPMMMIMVILIKAGMIECLLLGDWLVIDLVVKCKVDWLLYFSMSLVCLVIADFFMWFSLVNSWWLGFLIGSGKSLYVD